MTIYSKYLHYALLYPPYAQNLHREARCINIYSRQMIGYAIQSNLGAIGVSKSNTLMGGGRRTGMTPPWEIVLRFSLIFSGSCIRRRNLQIGADQPVICKKNINTENAVARLIRLGSIWCRKLTPIKI